MLNIAIKLQQVGEFILKTAMIGLFALLSLRGCDIALKKAGTSGLSRVPIMASGWLSCQM